MARARRLPRESSTALLQSYTNGGLRGSLVSVGRYHCGVAWCSGGGASGNGLPSRTNDEKKWVSFGERSDSSCGSGGYIVYRRDVCASPVFLLHDAHFVDEATIADLRLGQGLSQFARVEGEISVDLLADRSLTEPCVSHVLKLFGINKKRVLGCSRGLADWLSGLIRSVSKIHTHTNLQASLHMTCGGRRVLDFPSQGWHLGRYLARASVSCASGGVLRRHHGRTVCRASLRAETRKQGLAIDSKRASV